MAGYNGYSMSNNAVEAYRSGEMPRSRWTKDAIISAMRENGCSQEIIDAAKKTTAAVLKEVALEASSWHHTSKYFNSTDFYSVILDEDSTLDNFNADVRWVNENRVTKKTEPQAETWECEYLVWSGTRKHPKATVMTAVGEIRGNWFYLPDGSKKSITANGFRKIARR